MLALLFFGSSLSPQTVRRRDGGRKGVEETTRKSHERENKGGKEIKQHVFVFSLLADIWVVALRLGALILMLGAGVFERKEEGGGEEKNMEKKRRN